MSNSSNALSFRSLNSSISNYFVSSVSRWQIAAGVGVVAVVMVVAYAIFRRWQGGGVDADGGKGVKGLEGTQPMVPNPEKESTAALNSEATQPQTINEVQAENKKQAHKECEKLFSLKQIREWAATQPTANMTQLFDKNAVRKTILTKVLVLDPECGLGFSLLGDTLNDAENACYIKTPFTPNSEPKERSGTPPYTPAEEGWMGSIECWTKSIELSPEHFSAYENLARALQSNTNLGPTLTICGEEWTADKLLVKAEELIPDTYKAVRRLPSGKKEGSKAAAAQPQGVGASAQKVENKKIGS